MADEKEKKPISNILRVKTTEDMDKSIARFLKARGDVVTKPDAGALLISKNIIDLHSTIIEKIDKNLRGLSKSVSVALGGKNKAKVEDTSDRRAKTMGQRVTVVGFSEDALNKLNVKPKNHIKKVQEEREKTNKTDFLKKLLIAATPFIMSGGLIMSDGGPLRGIMNILSKVFVLIGNSLVKAIPSMGWLTKIFEKGGFVRNILAKIFGKGSFITKIFGRSGAKLGLGLFKGVGKAFLKRLPIIGSLISLGSAFKRIKDGDYLGGLIDVAAAVAYLFPGVGTAIGIFLDVINASSDIYGEKKGVSKAASIGGMFKDIGKWIYDKVSSIMDSMLQWVANQLYDLIPDKFVDFALDALGLERYKKNSIDKINEQISAKRDAIKKYKPDPDSKNRRKHNFVLKTQADIDELTEERDKAYEKEFERGNISESEYLNYRLQSMVAKSSSGVSISSKQVKELEDRGFSREEIGEIIREMRDAVREQTETMKEKQQPTTTTVANRGGDTNIYQQSGSKVTEQRLNLQPRYMSAY